MYVLKSRYQRWCEDGKNEAADSVHKKCSSSSRNYPQDYHIRSTAESSKCDTIFDDSSMQQLLYIVPVIISEACHMYEFASIVGNSYC